MALPVSRGRSIGSDHRLRLAEGPRRRDRTGVLSQGTSLERQSLPAYRHPRRSPTQPLSVVETAHGARPMARCQSAHLPIPEQHRRAGSSGHQGPVRTDEVLQVVRHCCNHACRIGVGSSYPQAPVLLWVVATVSGTTECETGASRWREHWKLTGVILRPNPALHRSG